MPDLTARRVLLLAAYWTPITLLAAIASLAAALPFTGLACEPQRRTR